SESGPSFFINSVNIMRPLSNLNSHLTLLGIAASSVLLSGCNDEVFVKPLPEISSVALSPEGDHKVIDLG
ncbi:hypothetical protein DK853_53955, partial [Klebsiella oxytoca]